MGAHTMALNVLYLYVCLFSITYSNANLIDELNLATSALSHEARHDRAESSVFSTHIAIATLCMACFLGKIGLSMGPTWKFFQSMSMAAKLTFNGNLTLRNNGGRSEITTRKPMRCNSEQSKKVHNKKSEDNSVATTKSRCELEKSQLRRKFKQSSINGRCETICGCKNCTRRKLKEQHEQYEQQQRPVFNLESFATPKTADRQQHPVFKLENIIAPKKPGLKPCLRNREGTFPATTLYKNQVRHARQREFFS